MIGIELAKQLRRQRTYLTLGALAGFPVVLTVALSATGAGRVEHVGDIPLLLVPATSVFTVPVIALASTMKFSTAAVAIASASSLLSGVLAFGWRPLAVLDLEHTTPFLVSSATFPPGAALNRVLLATALLLLTTASTFAFAVFPSTLTASPFAAVAGAVGLGLASRALDNVPGLNVLGAWLPLTDSGSTLWTGLFFQPMKLDGLGHLMLVQGLYTTVFLGAAWWRFARADVLA